MSIRTPNSGNGLSRGSRRVARLIAALVTFAALLLVALPALAGTIQIKDTADVLTSDQEAALRAKGGQYPFDVRVVTSGAIASKNAFDRYVADQVVSPNMVVVGLDPEHRRTSVHFGTGARIAASEYKAIEDAGDSHFRDRDFQGGVAAILDRATTAVGTGAALTTGAAGAAGATEPRRGSNIGTSIVLGGVGFIVVVVVMAFVNRRRAQNAAPIYNQGPYAGGPPPGGGYGPGYGPQGYYGGGGSGMGGNLMSAGLGGLVGYEIGKHVAGGNDHHHGGDAGYTGGDAGGGESAGYDAGGSTSDWGGDGGGDAGGGGDFGGGGDGGGGGDW